MGHPDYIIRNYRPGDLDKLIQLGAEVERLRQTYYSTSLKELVEGIGSPNHLPEDDLFVAEIAGNIVGYVDVMPELSIRRVVLSYLVHPGHRRKGLAKRLVECAIHRARELRAKIAHVNIPQDNAPAKRLFSKMGFRRIRRFLELRLDLSEAHLLKANQTASLFRQMRHGEEDKLLQIQNRSFADTWGFSPNTIEEIIDRISLPNCSPEDVILAYDADKPIGYCWTKIDPGENKSVSGSKGRIYMLGVNQDHRGKGVGSQVLLAGLSYLKGKGIGIVELTVDSENKAACALYRSVGFDVWTTSLWYEKVLD
jgi:mycothiol synthase